MGFLCSRYIQAQAPRGERSDSRLLQKAEQELIFDAPPSPVIPSLVSLNFVYRSTSSIRFSLQVHSVADVGHIMGGPLGREFLGGAFFLYMIMISGSGMLGVSRLRNLKLKLDGLPAFSRSTLFAAFYRKLTMTFCRSLSP